MSVEIRLLEDVSVVDKYSVVLSVNPQNIQMEILYSAKFNLALVRCISGFSKEELDDLIPGDDGSIIPNRIDNIMYLLMRWQLTLQK